MSKLIESDEILNYCERLIECERKQGTDIMNYGQERVNQTEAIMQHIKYNSPSIDAVPRAKIQEAITQIELHLRSVKLALKCLKEGDAMITTMEAAKKTLEECLDIIHENCG